MVPPTLNEIISSLKDTKLRYMLSSNTKHICFRVMPTYSKTSRNY